GAIADLRPQARNDDLLALVLGEGIAHFLIIPGIHRCALEQRQIRKNGKQFRIGVTREALGLHRRDSRWEVEDFPCLREGHQVVLQHLTIDRLDAESHLGLLIDKEKLRIVGSENLKLWVGHSSSPSLEGSTRKVPCGFRMDFAFLGPRLSAEPTRALA